ncbi:MAG TPA: secretin N-terminal domain-containing protein [Terriglobia bacterium]|nr:secretin N-terminal domain-containing protein [Terriglobia bacterium]
MMNKEWRMLASCLAIVWLVGCSPGNVAYREAQKAELRKDWDTALVDYEKAGRNQPENAKIIIHQKLVRTQATASHFKQGERLLKEGHPDEAAAEFQKAVSIDPTNDAAAQELARLEAAQAAARKARESALKQALKANEEVVNEPEIKLKPFPKEHLAHFRISADSRKVFDALGKLAQLNVAFTSNFRPTPQFSVDLSDVTIEEALNIVALQTHSFWRPITPNTILVVPDDPTNRRDYDVEELKTIYLSNPLAAADRTAITTALKTVLRLTNIVDNPDSNAIIIRDTPAKIAAAEQLVHELDRSKAEIVMEVAVVEADRDRARDLGIYPATITSATSITPGLQGGVIFSPPVPSSSSSSSSTTTSSTGINLLANFSTRDFAAVVPSVAASALLSDTRTHILQNPEIRSTDGQKAALKIGESVPIATGSFLPTLGSTTSTSGVGLLASTQFTYKDIGVILDLTPHLLADGEVAIHASIEISSLGANVSVAGVTEPTFGERKIEHDIRLKEGETSVLGGLIQTTITHTVGGVPFLGDVPLLKYLFSTEHAERNEQEVLIMLTPHVVRLPEPSSGAPSSVALTVGAQPAGPQGIPGAEIPAQPPGEPQ